MKRVRAKIKNKASSYAERYQRFVKKHVSMVLFIAFVIVGTGGYVIGVNHFQIEALVGPVFGYKAHDASIDLSSLEETYNKLASRYDGDIDMTNLIYGANKGMVEAVGDTYTVYMTPAESSEFSNSLSGSIGGGIGALIGLKKDQITIMRVIDDNPAIKAGLLAGDTVLKINDQSTSGWSVDKAVGKIRGDAGTTVKLTIQRGSETKDYTITRAIVNNPSVTSSISDGLGIITISRFDEETGSLARLAAQDFIKQNVKSVILDLRDNGGGYVNAARDVAGLWLEDKIITTERTGEVIKKTIRSEGRALLVDIPTVVLVNGGSASASEIVAGALQDYDAAKIVGETTFGKGSVQELVNLTSGAELKVTVARWYTPKGNNINGSGIKPDYTIEMTQADVDNDDDPQLDKAKEVLGY